jgi:hypothetical protein
MLLASSELRTSSNLYSGCKSVLLTTLRTCSTQLLLHCNGQLQAVEDATFLLQKSLDRSMSTRSEQAIMAIVNRIADLLDPQARHPSLYSGLTAAAPLTRAAAASTSNTDSSNGTGASPPVPQVSWRRYCARHHNTLHVWLCCCFVFSIAEWYANLQCASTQMGLRHAHSVTSTAVLVVVTALLLSATDSLLMICTVLMYFVRTEH